MLSISFQYILSFSKRNSRQSIIQPKILPAHIKHFGRVLPFQKLANTSIAIAVQNRKTTEKERRRKKNTANYILSNFSCMRSASAFELLKSLNILFHHSCNRKRQVANQRKKERHTHDSQLVSNGQRFESQH